MKFIFNTLKSFTRFEIILWASSSLIILLSFLIPNSKNYLTLLASLVGATALIFVSKGNIVGQILTVVFSVIYGFISFSFHYYGEMITYLGMTTPIAIASIFTWLNNPYKGKKYQVKINDIKYKEYLFMFILGIVVSLAFYFILDYFNTNYLLLSTVSVFTSFIASYLTVRRSPLYAIAYALNDIVLIILWTTATISQISYLPMVSCFIVFLANDLYGFINWSKTKRKQIQANSH